MTDCPADLPASQPNPSSEPKVTVTGVDGVTRIVQGVEGEIPDGVEYTFGPCDTCGEMFCEHERMSQPVVSSARVDLDLDQIEARSAHLDTDEYNNGVPANAPWRAAPSCSGRDRWIVYQPTGSDQTRIITEGLRQPFADFIAHAREDVPRLVAEVRRLRETLAMANYACEQANRLTAGQKKLTDKAAAERDAARAEAERLREGWCGESEHGHSTEACCSCCYRVSAERAEAARVREALQAVRDILDWLTSMGEPTHEALETRRVVTLGDIISRARAALRALDAALDGAE